MYYIDKMPQFVEIGYTGETNFRTIEIDLSEWMSVMPEGVPSIVHVRPGETMSEAYIAATTFANNILSWTISAGDIGESEGTGLAQVWLEHTSNNTLDKVGMSVVFATLVRQSVGDGLSETPAAQLPWLQQMTSLKTQTVTASLEAIAAQGAAETAQGAAETAQTAAETAQGKAEDAQEAAEAAQAAMEVHTEDAEAWAVGKRGGVDVESTDPTYHNNSKYFATQASSSATTATTKAGEAATAKTAAETAQGKAETAQDKAEDAQTAAETAQGKAETAQGKSEDAQTASETAQGKAEDAQTAAETAQGKAEDAQTAAETAQGAAENSAEDAEAWAVGKRNNVDVTSDDPAYNNNSKYYAGEASSSATTANTKAGEAATAKTAAETAQGKAEDAQTAAEAAQTAAETAQGKAEDAQDAAEAAQTAAETAQTAAETAKTAAQTAASTASAAYNVNLLAPNYDSTATYKVGEHVIYSGGYYECISPITTAEAWTAAHWRQLTVGGEATDLKSALTALSDNEYEYLSGYYTGSEFVQSASHKCYHFAKPYFVVKLKFKVLSDVGNVLTFIQGETKTTPTINRGTYEYTISGYDEVWFNAWNTSIVTDIEMSSIIVEQEAKIDDVNSTLCQITNDEYEYLSGYYTGTAFVENASYKCYHFTKPYFAVTLKFKVLSDVGNVLTFVKGETVTKPTINRGTYEYTISDFDEVWFNAWNTTIVTNIEILNNKTGDFDKTVIQNGIRLTEGVSNGVLINNKITGIGSHIHIFNNEIKRIKFRVLMGNAGILYARESTNDTFTVFGTNIDDYDIDTSGYKELVINFFGPTYCQYVDINDYESITPGGDSYDWTYYGLGYIKNNMLIFNELCDSEHGQAVYQGVKLDNVPDKISCKCIFSSFTGTTEDDGSSGGHAVLILNPNGLNGPENIVARSLHCVFTDVNCHVEVYNNESATRLYTEEYSSRLPKNTEYEFYVEIVSDHELNIKTATGVHNVTVQNVSISDYTGVYMTLEHFVYRGGASKPNFTEFKAVKNNFTVFYDNYIRPDGVIGVPLTGQNYVQYGSIGGNVPNKDKWAWRN